MQLSFKIKKLKIWFLRILFTCT